MAEVVFMSGIADVLGFASRLLRKKLKEGDERLAVLGPPQLLQRLDQQLWLEPVGEFMPHWRHRPGAALSVGAGRTKVWLLEQADPQLACSTGVNLGLDADAMRGFARVAELVSTAPDDARRARQRWRQYAEWGWQVKHHQFSS